MHSTLEAALERYDGALIEGALCSERTIVLSIVHSELQSYTQLVHLCRACMRPQDAGSAWALGSSQCCGAIRPDAGV